MKKELTDLFKNTEISEAQNFNSIKISLASPEKIKIRGHSCNFYIVYSSRGNFKC